MNTLARTGSQQLLQYHFIHTDFIFCCWTPNFYHIINNFLIFHLRPLPTYPNHFSPLNIIFTKLSTNPFRIQISFRLTAEAAAAESTGAVHPQSAHHSPHQLITTGKNTLIHNRQDLRQTIFFRGAWLTRVKYDFSGYVALNQQNVQEQIISKKVQIN